MLGAWALLVAAIGLAWANSVPGGPIFDDHFLILGQDCYRSLGGILRIFTFDSAYGCTYRPTRYISYGVDYALSGGAFWGFHIGNIARHVWAALAAAALASELARRAAALGSRGGEGRQPAVPTACFVFVVVALWALHPVQTDSVSYVSGRRDILAGLWTFVSVWTALVADRRGGLWWLIPLWATLLAFLSKESAVVVPALYLLWRLRESSLRRWLREHFATALAGVVGLTLSFLLVLYRGVFESQSNRGFEWWGGSVVSNFATVAVLQVHYLRHVLLAHPLIGDYKPDTIPLAADFGDPRALAGLAVLVALLAVVLACRRRRPLVSYGVAWYLVALTPVSHFFPHHELFAEHYLYIPLFGIVLALVDAGVWAIESAPDVRRWRRIAALSAAALALVMALKVVVRNRDFRDERAFYENVVAHAPDNVRAVANLGNITFEAGEYDDAVHWLGLLAPVWVPGSSDERHHVTLLLEAAVRANRTEVAAAAAEQLAENHPDIGVGHRWRAQLAAGSGRHAEAFDAALRWWERTRDPRALGTAVGAWHAGRLGAEPADRLARAVEAADAPDPRALAGAAAALRDSGAADRALELLLAHRPEPPDGPFELELCRTAEAAGAEPPSGCERAAPEGEGADRTP